MVASDGANGRWPGWEGSDMSGGVWMSSVLSNSAIGYKLGLRRKPYGQDWDPEAHAPPPVGHTVVQSLNRYTRGETVSRNELPEAAAVWDQRSFKRAKDIFTVGGFYCVKGALAEVLSRFDLGEGGLIPFPVYQADLATPYPGEFFLLNFGAIKNTILSEQCEDARKFYIDKDSGLQVWKINQLYPDGQVVVSSLALIGSDLWFEQVAHDRIFMSDALAQAIIEIGMGDVFRLKQCRIAGGAA